MYAICQRNKEKATEIAESLLGLKKSIRINDELLKDPNIDCQYTFNTPNSKNHAEQSLKAPSERANMWPAPSQWPTTVGRIVGRL